MHVRFSEAVAQTLAWLQREGRVSYRALKREFALDDDFLADLKEELIAIKELAIDKDGKMLVWVGEESLASRVQSPASRTLPPSDPRPLTPDPRSYTPKHLAEKILQSKAALEGERKQVTVLFADVKGSMELAEQLDPADRARHFSSEALHLAERFGADRNVVYALLACGIASHLALRWEEGDGFLERAIKLVSATGAGREWTMLIDGVQALCWAGMGDRERSMDLARRGVEQAHANALDMPRLFQGALRVRVLRMVGGVGQQGELEAQIAETLELIQRTDAQGWFPLVLLERAGLARLRGDADGMARDLAEARRLFARMGVTGWDDYARSIEA